MIIVFFIINTGYNIYQNSQYDKDKQWYLTEGAADVANTWNLKNKTAKKVTVAVIDTGVDYNHEMLKGHMWKNEKEIEGNGIDDDENGFIDDIIGWNFTNNTNDVLSGEEYYENDHGTECASIISAGSEWTKYKGINYRKDVKIMSLKVLKGIEKEGNVEDVIRAIKYAENNGADICNLSLNFKEYNEKLETVIKKSHMLFVVSAGNDAVNIDIRKIYLASFHYDNVISVAAIDQDYELYSNSNYGKESVDIAAPGVNIYCAVVNGYDYDTGTSMSTAIVSGVAAMIMSKYDVDSASGIKHIIMQNSKRSSKLQGVVISGGMLNAYNCLRNK